jgi:hypothetical protein
MEMQGISKSFYASVHYWLKYHYGKATKCEGKECRGKSKNYSWAKLRDKKYDYKRENFIQLCRSCHGRYDITEDSKLAISKKMKGRKPSVRVKGNCAGCKVALPIPRHPSMLYCPPCFEKSVVVSREKWQSDNRERMLKMKRDYARKRFGYKKTHAKYAHEQN